MAISTLVALATETLAPIAGGILTNILKEQGKKAIEGVRENLNESRQTLVYQFSRQVELEEILLAEIAYTNFIEDQLFFEKRSLINAIKRVLEENLNAPKYLNGEAVLNAIAVQQGILVERAEEIYSFSHLTLQEYLTAQYIVDNDKDYDTIDKLVANHLLDPTWKEVFLLVAGLMKGRKERIDF
ncbi:MAG: NACHT domain-containing NTPase [Spirulina sp.]